MILLFGQALPTDGWSRVDRIRAETPTDRLVGDRTGRRKFGGFDCAGGNTGEAGPPSFSAVQYPPSSGRSRVLRPGSTLITGIAQPAEIEKSLIYLRMRATSAHSPPVASLAAESGLDSLRAIRAETLGMLDGVYPGMGARRSGVASPLFDNPRLRVGLILRPARGDTSGPIAWTPRELRRGRHSNRRAGPQEADSSHLP
jgi:hypothetical protein